MIAIILGTPLWVWPLLAYLLWSGWRATGQHEFRPPGSLILPGAFLLLSVRSLLLREGMPVLVIVVWVIGAAAGAAAGWLTAKRAEARPREDLRALEVPGTWSILILSLVVFAVQYAIGYWRATQPELLEQPPLTGVMPLVSAASTFFFVGRAAAFLKALRG